MKRKIVAVVISLAVFGTALPISVQANRDEIENGEIISNPWEDLFEETTTKKTEKTTCKGPEKPTTKEKLTTTKIGTVKITKKITKKKTAKKLKITIKKIKSVKGYQVYAFRNKTAAKKNKKLLYKKTITKNVKVLKISSKKLKKKKKLFIKVRAYKVVNGKKVYGSWSKIVRVKIK